MNYVEEIHQLVGEASRCWREDGTFEETRALEIATRLCDIVVEEKKSIIRLDEEYRNQGKRPVAKMRRRRKV